VVEQLVVQLARTRFDGAIDNVLPLGSAVRFVVGDGADHTGVWSAGAGAAGWAALAVLAAVITARRRDWA
jgi:hypothetical protein